MSAHVINFPGAPHRTVPARPTCIAELEGEAKAIVISEQDGRFTVALAPAVTKRELATRVSFREVQRARAYAREMAIRYPRLYQLILDETEDAA
jgi:hypothetical protein